MLKPILSSLILLAGLQAHAERLPATNFGLTPETGYLEVVTEGEVCNQDRDVLLTKVHGDPKFITKCDGSLIGWVTRTVLAEEHLADRISEYSYDRGIETGAVYDRFRNTEINIYACDEGRADELLKFPNKHAATDPKKTYERLEALKKSGKSVSMELFFNEFVYSGKCIGRVTEQSVAEMLRVISLRISSKQ